LRILTNLTSIWRPYWWWPSWNFANMFGTRKTRVLTYHTALFALSSIAVLQYRLVTARRLDRHIDRQTNEQTNIRL